MRAESTDLHCVSKGRLFLFFLLLFVRTFQAFGQAPFSTASGETPIAGILTGDQTHPAVSVNAYGGYVVWQDNSSDGSDLGIRARRIDSELQGVGTAFRVNKESTGRQESPQIAVLKNGTAAFVWRSNHGGKFQIYTRFYSVRGAFIHTDDLQVNSWTAGDHLSPAVAELKDGNVIVVWASQGQDGSLQGIYGQLLSPSGQKIGSEFQINTFTLYNQRTPAVAALSDGKFVVSWISESGSQATGLFNVNVFARVFKADGSAFSLSEFRVSGSNPVCANPAIAAAADGSFTILWSQKDRPILAERSRIEGGTTGGLVLEVEGNEGVNTNSWDVFGRCYKADGSAATQGARVNSSNYGSQYGPKIASSGTDYLAVWTSMAQDGSSEGVYGQYLGPALQPIGKEFRVNSVTISRQILPTVTAHPDKKFVAVWSSYLGGDASFDLIGQPQNILRTFLTIGPNGPILNWNSSPGVSYRIQISSDLQTWTDLQWVPVESQGATTSFPLNQQMNPKAFYRVIRNQ